MRSDGTNSWGVANGIEALQQAIMREAQEEIEHVLADAKAQAASIQAQAREEANDRRNGILEKAKKEAGARHDTAVAQAHMEAQRLKLKRREALLHHPFVEARRQLSTVTQGSDYDQTVRKLVREGVERLRSDEVIVRADAETGKVLDDGTLEALGQELNTRLTAGPPLTSGTGVVLVTPDGHRRYDNRLETRLARMEEALRAPVYHILTGETP